MSTTLAVRFPLGRYHANPWNRAVNEGVTEWPPSPWRVLRALIATWYTRWPDLPAAAMDTLLEALADPPSYRTPRAYAGHTRHYLADLEHRKGEQGSTDLTLDPFLSVAPDEELLIRWDADLSAGQRDILHKLAELIPYLGRAESVCEARLRDEETVPDDSWWRPGVDGRRSTPLLAPAKPVSRAALEATTTEIRRSRRTMPPGTVWVTYTTGEERHADDDHSANRGTDKVTAVRFAVIGRPVSIKATHGVLLADEVHNRVGKILTEAMVPDERRHEIMGTKGARSGHRHAHWMFVPTSPDRGAAVDSLLVWVPEGLRPDELCALIGNLRKLSGKRGGDDGYEIRGFPKLELLFQAAGPIDQIAPSLCRGARRWRSLTPYLPVRHRKRESLDEFLAADIRAELSYRRGERPQVTVARIEPSTAMLDRWTSEFRRRRMKEGLADSRSARPGLGLRLEFAEQVEGPIVLGQLSHFGFGLFTPED